MAANPMKVWDGTAWVTVSPQISTTPISLQGTAPISANTGDIWIDSSVDIPSALSPTFTGTVTLMQTQEILNVGTISSNLFTADNSLGNVFYIPTAPAANFTINVTNPLVVENRVTSLSFFVVQGATGYIPNALQISGVAQTIKWASGIAPTPTSAAGKIDVFNFTLIRTSSAWQVLGDVSKNY
jgi:hypothetical protein